VREKREREKKNKTKEALWSRSQCKCKRERNKATSWSLADLVSIWSKEARVLKNLSSGFFCELRTLSCWVLRVSRRLLRLFKGKSENTECLKKRKRRTFFGSVFFVVRKKGNCKNGVECLFRWIWEACNKDDHSQVSFF